MFTLRKGLNRFRPIFAMSIHNLNNNNNDNKNNNQKNPLGHTVSVRLATSFTAWKTSPQVL